MGICGIIELFQEGAVAHLSTSVTDVRRFTLDGTDILSKVLTVSVAFCAQAALIKRGMSASVFADALTFTAFPKLAWVKGIAWAPTLFIKGVSFYFLGNRCPVFPEIPADCTERLMLFEAAGNLQTVLIG